jgi:excisionase family DNA binding protein
MLDQRNEAAVTQIVRSVLSQIPTAPAEETPTGFMTVNEVAEAIGVSRETIRRLCASKKMPALDCGAGDQANYRIPRAFVMRAQRVVENGRNVTMSELTGEWNADLAVAS